MSGPNLASTFFQTGPSDDLAVVDIYSVGDTKVKTSLMDRLQNTAGNIVNTIVANPALLNTVVSSLTNVGGQVAFDRNSLMDSLSSTSMGYRGRSMGGDITGGIMNSIGRTLNNLTGDPRKSLGIISKIGSVVDVMSYDDLASSQNISSFLTNLTGQSDIASTIGLDAEAAVLGTFMTEAIGIGSVGAFETMLDAYDGKPEYDQVVRGVMVGSFDQSARSGNLGMIQTLVSNLGGRAIRSQVPYANSTILNSYRFPKNTTSGGYRGQLTTLKNVLSGIDPQWNVSNRRVVNVVGNENVYVNQECRRLDAFAYAHDDARDLFMLDENHKIDMMIARTYNRIDCRQNIQEKYPYAIGVN